MKHFIMVFIECSVPDCTFTTDDVSEALAIALLITTWPTAIWRMLLQTLRQHLQRSKAQN